MYPPSIPPRDHRTTATDLTSTLCSLLNLPAETEWVEFKHNNASPPEKIGEYLSALFNSAALHGKTEGYLVWGVEDETHKVVGITRWAKWRKSKERGEERN